MRILQRTWPQWAIGLIVSCGLLRPLPAHSQPPASTTVDFATQVKPILAAKCFSCHSPTTLQAGGVQLDQRGGAKAGGYSQRPLLGGTLETNEIYRRVSSDDTTYRMPKGQPALTADEVSVFRRWVEAGTPWPEEPTAAVADHKWFDREAWLNYGERWLREVPGFTAWLCALLTLQIGFLFVERYKGAVQKQLAWTASPRARWLAPLKSVGVPHYLLLLTAMCLALSVQIILGLQAQLQMFKTQAAPGPGGTPAAVQLNTFSVYGNPPQPIRPDHPRRLSGTYYRGNCERNAELFNGGNYRTATLRIALMDRQGRSLNYGDTVPPDGVAVRFELERAQGTTEMLFGDGVTKGVFLSKQPLTDAFTAVTSPIERVRVVKPGWLWAATYPIAVPAGEPEQTLPGVIYVYQGTADSDQARGTFHFGIRYHLHLKDRVLQPDSELWMGSLFWSVALEHPNHGKIPMRQWFNHEPIPEINGPNSTDPKLLGIPEHLRKEQPVSPPAKKE